VAGGNAGPSGAGIEKVEPGVAHLHRNPDVFVRAELFEDVGDLKALRDTPSGVLMLGEPGDILAPKQHRPRAGRNRTAQDIEEGALAGAVGADDRAEMPGAKLHRDVGQGLKGAKALADVACLDQDFGRREPDHRPGGYRCFDTAW
jgi:hypothetical protein